ncbi:MAG: hypothetical protein H0W99_10200 [Acidobacteria bacterium]|nr:hypothetical protein [Acidobacteriota bacterium]
MVEDNVKSIEQYRAQKAADVQEVDHFSGCPEWLQSRADIKALVWAQCYAQLEGGMWAFSKFLCGENGVEYIRMWELVDWRAEPLPIVVNIRYGIEPSAVVNALRKVIEMVERDGLPETLIHPQPAKPDDKCVIR